MSSGGAFPSKSKSGSGLEIDLLDVNMRVHHRLDWDEGFVYEYVNANVNG